MFFRLGADPTRGGAEMVMVMGSQSGDEKDEKTYVCAAMYISNETEAAYELFVAKQ